MRTFIPGQLLQFYYLNHRGATEMRRAIFQGLDYGDNEWYPERQWFMRTWDITRGATRSFALTNIDLDTLTEGNV